MFFLNVTKIILTRCRIFSLKMHQFQFLLGLEKGERGGERKGNRKGAGDWEGKGKR